MVKEIKIHIGEGYKINEKGVFNLNKLYKEMHNWFDENKYDFQELNHVNKKLDKGEEITLEWEAEREVTDFIKFRIRTNFLLQEINPASDNLVSGKAKIIFTTHMLIDYRDDWVSSKFKNFLFDIYRKTLYQDKLKQYGGKLGKEVFQLHKVAKEVLDFYR